MAFASMRRRRFRLAKPAPIPNERSFRKAKAMVIIMKRSMMQAYVKNSRDAVEFYQRAFGASVGNVHLDCNGNYVHAELDIYGQVLALSETAHKVTEHGNTMQFCLHFDESERDIIKRAYDVMKEGANVDSPLGKCFFSPYMFALIDKFGVYWCVFC